MMLTVASGNRDMVCSSTQRSSRAYWAALKQILLEACHSQVAHQEIVKTAERIKTLPRKGRGMDRSDSKIFTSGTSI